MNSFLFLIPRIFVTGNIFCFRNKHLTYRATGCILCVIYYDNPFYAYTVILFSQLMQLWW